MRGEGGVYFINFILRRGTWIGSSFEGLLGGGNGGGGEEGFLIEDVIFFLGGRLGREFFTFCDVLKPPPP